MSEPQPANSSLAAIALQQPIHAATARASRATQADLHATAAALYATANQSSATAIGIYPVAANSHAQASRGSDTSVNHLPSLTEQRILATDRTSCAGVPVTGFPGLLATLRLMEAATVGRRASLSSQHNAHNHTHHNAHTRSPAAAAYPTPCPSSSRDAGTQANKIEGLFLIVSPELADRLPIVAGRFGLLVEVDGVQWVPRFELELKTCTYARELVGEMVSLLHWLIVGKYHRGWRQLSDSTLLLVLSTSSSRQMTLDECMVSLEMMKDVVLYGRDMFRAIIICLGDTASHVFQMVCEACSQAAVVQLWC